MSSLLLLVPNKMLRIVLVTLFCAQAFARPSSDLPFESHIVGGTEAKEGQFPFAVAIRDIDSKAPYCGGALLSDKYVLTAAHCVDRKRPSWVGVGAGSVNLYSQKLYKVDEIIVHPVNNVSVLFDDIALLRLSSPIPLGGNIQTINYFSDADQLVGKNVTVMGWGYTSQNGPISIKLLYVTSSVLSNEVCKKELEKAEREGAVGPGNICMKGQINHGTCYHDSGSPMIYKSSDGKSYVTGVTVWGIECAKGFPDVFTRVSTYAKWIKENMK